MTRETMSAAEARRLALWSLGLADARPGRSGIGALRALASRLHAFQIDSVNVLVRAHYMPAFSRLGPYPLHSLDELAYRKRELFEGWAHAACLIRTDLFPYFRWRSDAHAQSDWLANASKENRAYAEAVYAELAERGPLSASEVTGAGKAKGKWWGWSDGKEAMESLCWIGRAAVAGRRRFERVYDITERVIPAHVFATPAPSPDDAKKHLLVLAAGALGIGTARDLAGYFHIESLWDRPKTDGVRRKSELPRLVKELVLEKRLAQMAVEGWHEPGYTLPGVAVPASAAASAIVSPFDPVMWDRVDRKGGHYSQRVFGLEYKIEIYVPEPQRTYGYYCLMFLHGDRFAARVDLKADRKAGTLQVPGAFLEPPAPGEPAATAPTPAEVVPALAAELRSMAEWLELESIIVGERGDLARPLRKALGRRRGRT